MRFFKSEVRRVDRVHHSRGCQRKSLKEKPELLPRHPPVVRPPAEPHLPYADHLIPKGRQHVVVPRDPVVGVVTLQFPLEVIVLLLDWRMAIPPAPVTHLLERPRKTPSFGRPLDYPVSVAGSPPGVREPQEVERLPLRLLLVLWVPSVRSLESHHPCLFRMYRQTVLREPLWQYLHHPPGVLFVFEAQDGVVGISDDERLPLQARVPCLFAPLISDLREEH